MMPDEVRTPEEQARQLEWLRVSEAWLVFQTWLREEHPQGLTTRQILMAGGPGAEKARAALASIPAFDPAAEWAAQSRQLGRYLRGCAGFVTMQNHVLFEKSGFVWRARYFSG